MTIVGKFQMSPHNRCGESEILHLWHVCDVENVAIYAKFIAIYAILLLNLLFTLFCREISCGEKLSPKVHLWRRNDKYQLCYHILCPHCLVDTDMNKLHFSILKFDPPQPLNSNPKTYFDFKGRMFKSCSTPWKPTHSPFDISGSCRKYNLSTLVIVPAL